MKINIKNKNILCFNKYDLLIFTSYKVGFSSLKTLYHDKKLLFFNKGNSSKINFATIKNSLAIIRNPIARLESTYKDKVIINSNINNVQECQKEIIKIFSKEVFFNKEVTFQDFIYSLDKIINTNAHFYTQNSFIPDSIDKYLCIEKDMPILESLIKCKLPIKNKMPDMKLTWTKKMKDIVYSLYDIDFKRFHKQYQKI